MVFCCTRQNFATRYVPLEPAAPEQSAQDEPQPEAPEVPEKVIRYGSGSERKRNEPHP